jgi:hypothetical protein
LRPLTWFGYETRMAPGLSSRQPLPLSPFTPDADQLEDGRPVAGPVASYLLAAAPSYPRLFEKRCSHWHERGNRPDELGQRLSWTASVRRQSGPQRRADQLE